MSTVLFIAFVAAAVAARFYFGLKYAQYFDSLSPEQRAEQIKQLRHRCY